MIGLDSKSVGIYQDTVHVIVVVRRQVRALLSLALNHVAKGLVLPPMSLLAPVTILAGHNDGIAREHTL